MADQVLILQGLTPDSSVGTLDPDRPVVILPMPNGYDTPVVIDSNADSMSSFMNELGKDENGGGLKIDLILNTGEEHQPQKQETIQVTDPTDTDRFELEKKVPTLKHLRAKHEAAIQIYDKLSGPSRSADANRSALKDVLDLSDAEKAQLKAAAQLIVDLFSQSPSQK